jgi:hypothetical protein
VSISEESTVMPGQTARTGDRVQAGGYGRRERARQCAVWAMKAC